MASVRSPIIEDGSWRLISRKQIVYLGSDGRSQFAELMRRRRQGVIHAKANRLLGSYGMKCKRLTSLALVIILAVCAPLFAHHGNASLNTDKLVVIQDATVVRPVWANPHCIVAFDARDEKGNVARW